MWADRSLEVCCLLWTVAYIEHTVPRLKRAGRDADAFASSYSSANKCTKTRSSVATAVGMATATRGISTGERGRQPIRRLHQNYLGSTCGRAARLPWSRVKAGRNLSVLFFSFRVGSDTNAWVIVLGEEARAIAALSARQEEHRLNQTENYKAKNAKFLFWQAAFVLTDILCSTPSCRAQYPQLLTARH